MLKAKQKIYVLDTNIILSDPRSMGEFDNNIVLIPSAVLEELDNHKKDKGETGWAAREAARFLEKYRKKGKLRDGIKTANGGIICVSDHVDTTGMPTSWDLKKLDNQILGTALYYHNAKVYGKDKPVILVTNDTNLRIKADQIGLPAEEYRHERVEDDVIEYTGRSEIYVPDKEFVRFCQGKEIKPEGTDGYGFPFAEEIFENEFFIVHSNITGGTKLARIKKGMLTQLVTEKETPYGVMSRNAGQKFAIEALLAPADEIPLVILKGSAGSAKTFLTLACGLEQTMEQDVYRRITITRANVEFDKDIGALPGDEQEKINPLLRGAIDNLELLVDANGVVGSEEYDEDELKAKVRYLFDHGYISAEALGFIRGRSLTRQILFVDEAQNTTQGQMRAILTRAGKGTKVVIAGDLGQIDNWTQVNRHTCGLAYAMKIMRGDPLCAVVGFNQENETTRSALAARVASIIEKEEHT